MNVHLSFDLSFTTNTFSGKYYAIEGIDGSGKTTQVHRLARFFKEQGHKVYITKEPTNSIIGNVIHLVLEKKLVLPFISLQYLFCADRAVHLENDVIPALRAGNIVLSDRSLWSSVAYGISDLQLQQNEKQRLLVAYNLLSMYGGFLIPDKTFFLKIQSDIAVKRMDNRQKSLSIYEHKEKLRSIEKEYEWLAEKFSQFIKIIPDDKFNDIEEVTKLIIANV